jgi:hypothetical protein
MDMRSEAHFIRQTDGQEPDAFYTETKDVHRGRRGNYLSDEKGLVKFVDINKCEPKMFWKFETRTYRMELSYKATEVYAPFDEMHIFFKLITANCRPGTNRVKFHYQEDESDYSGLKQPIQGHYPSNLDAKGNVVARINSQHSYGSNDTSWDRLYVSIRFKSYKAQPILQYYVVPTLLFMYLVIHPFEESDNLLGVSSTLVLANVALLIIDGNNVFNYYEQAVLVQIVMIIIGTIVLLLIGERKSGVTIICLTAVDFAVSCITVLLHWYTAKKRNGEINDAIEKNDFALLGTI